MNRQKLALAVLLGIFVVALVASYYRMPRQKTVAKLTYTQGSRAEVKRPGTAQQPDDTKLHLDLLDREQPPFAGFRRNIFKPLFHEEAKLPGGQSSRPMAIPLPPPPPPLPPQPATPAQAIEQPTPLQQDMARFTFLGFLKKGALKIIFLSKDKDIFLVKKGDKLAGRYEVTSITDEALTIQVQGDGGEIVIPLTENRALSAPRS
ncbi:MAG: hypothetical protein CXR31_07180 [Geobacter sp.]|nr:MAG: hypothetical protein CXR31_07180 [Geobacter sp.]